MKTHPDLQFNAPPGLKQTNRTWRFYALMSVGALLLLGAAVLTGLFIFARTLIGKYTTPQPAPITQIQVTEDDRQALMAKWSEFLNALQSGQPAPPLSMSSEEVNVFVAMMPNLNHRFHVTIAENRLRAEFAIPLDDLPGPHLPAMPKGRYANGVALLNMSLGPDHHPRFDLDSLTLNGRPVPEWAKTQGLRGPHARNVLAMLDKNALLSRLRSIEVRGDQLVFVPVNSM
jgi:hypothetical protein